MRRRGGVGRDKAHLQGPDLTGYLGSCGLGKMRDEGPGLGVDKSRQTSLEEAGCSVVGE